MTEKKSLAKETKQILNENGIILNKNLGQNYLIDDFKRKKIIEYAKLSKEDTVLEIGPGIGTLTLELAKRAKKVIAIEQDTTIFNILQKRLEKQGYLRRERPDSDERRLYLFLTETGEALKERALEIPRLMRGCIDLPAEELQQLKHLLDKALTRMNEES